MSGALGMGLGIPFKTTVRGGGDITSPSLSSWSVDLSAETITLVFNKTVDASTLDVTAITLQDAATSANEYTLTDSTTASGDGGTIVIDLSTTDVNAINADGNLLTSISDSYIRFTSSMIDDLSATPVTAVTDGSAVQASSYTGGGDVTPPNLTTWALNLNTGQITLNFDEDVAVATLDVTALTIQDAATSEDEYTLTNSTSPSSDGTSIIINLSTTDLNALKLDQSLASSISDSYVRFTSSLIEDTSANAVNAVADGSGVQASTFIADSTSPSLSSWSLDLSAETVTLVFDEPVDASTLNATAITIQDAATELTSRTLVGGTTASSDGTTIVVDLGSTDVSALISDTDLATSISNSYIRITASLIDDIAGNSVNAIADGSAVQASSYTAETTSPSLSSWSADWDAGTMTLVFDESVDASTLTVTGITVQDAATAVNSYALTDSTTASSDGTSIVVDLSSTDLTAIRQDHDIARTTSDAYLTITSAVIDDLAGNDVNAIADGSGQQATSVTYTYTPADESNAFLWYDFSDTSTMTLDGADIADITDKIQSFTVSQGPSSARPTLTTLGAVNVGSFDYVDDLLTNNSEIPFDGTETKLDFIALVHYPSNPTGNTVIWALGDTNGDTGSAYYQFNSTDYQNGTTGYSRMLERADDDVVDRVTGTTTNATSAGNTHLLHVVVDDGNPWALFTDGVSQSISIVAGSNTGEPPGDWMGKTDNHAFSIGTANTNGNIAHMGGYILQLFCFEGTNLDSAAKDRLTDWINTKYSESFSY